MTRPYGSEQEVIEAMARLGLPEAEARRSEVRVDVTVKVVPMSTDLPVRSETTSLLFTEGDYPEASRRSIVGNAAATLYPRAAGVSIPTPPQEGGR